MQDTFICQQCSSRTTVAAIPLDEAEAHQHWHQLMLVGAVHGDAAAEHLATNHPEAFQLVSQGWTVMAALDHTQGICDQAICTHPSHQEVGA